MIEHPIFADEPIEKRLAEEAVKYANDCILKSSSGLAQLNEVVNYHVIRIDKGIEAVRDVKEINISNDHIVRVDEDDFLFTFFRDVELIKKYSMGNCEEYAFVALDYIFEKNPSVTAELFYIKGGDHIFLVIGRDPASDPGLPEDWGEHAYICDPWARDSYKANLYQTKLKNYNFSSAEHKHYVEDLKPEHKLVLASLCGEDISTSSLSKCISDVYLNQMQMMFKAKIDLIFSSIQTFKLDITKIADQLKIKYGEKDQKFIILNKKIQEAEQILNKLAELNELSPPFEAKSIEIDVHDYLQMRTALQSKLGIARAEADKLFFDADSMEILKEFKNENKIQSKIQKFFYQYPSTVLAVDKALEKLANNLEDLKFKPILKGKPLELRS